jgi:very-short-patch-repair endonuclease
MSRVIYDKIEKSCPECGKKFHTLKGHPKEQLNCSRSCSNRQRTLSLQTREKISASLCKEKSYLNCGWCKNSFQPLQKKIRFCSTSCASKNRQSNPEVLEKLRAAQLRLIASGAHKGWRSRAKFAQSFPEKYVEELLSKEFYFIRHRDFEIEFPQGKWFIDFAFLAKKIALEIDGKQHEFLERRASDIEKDKYLVEQGWIVHRVKWKRIRSKQDREAVISTLKQIFV